MWSIIHVIDIAHYPHCQRVTIVVSDNWRSFLQSFVLEGLEENMTYNITVAVRNANGTSPPSMEHPGMTANEGG